MGKAHQVDYKTQAGLPSRQPRCATASSVTVYGEAALRSKFLSAAMSFDAASRERSPSEQEIEAELREAVSGGHVNQTSASKPLLVPASRVTCSPDFNQCPIGWVQSKSICVKSEPFQGRSSCGSRYSLGSFSQAQKEALAESCGWTFPCQTDECQMDLEEPCPTLWREERSGECIAPASYVGACNAKIFVKGSVSLLQQFGSRCC